MQLMQQAYPNLIVLFYWIGGFALFAFLTTLSREIIKDIEDFEGDMAYGRNTLPVVTGIPASKIIAVSLMVLTIALLYLVWYFYVHDWITLVYMSVAIVVPLLFVILPGCSPARTRNRSTVPATS